MTATASVRAGNLNGFHVGRGLLVAGKWRKITQIHHGHAVTIRLEGSSSKHVVRASREETLILTTREFYR